MPDEIRIETDMKGLKDPKLAPGNDNVIITAKSTDKRVVWITLARDLAFDLATDSARDIIVPFELDYDDRDLASARRDLASARARDIIVPFELDLVDDLAGSHALINVYARARARARDLARDLDLNRDLDRDLDLGSAAELASDIAIELASARDIAIDLAIDLANARDLASACDLAFLIFQATEYAIDPDQADLERTKKLFEDLRRLAKEFEFHYVDIDSYEALLLGSKMYFAIKLIDAKRGDEKLTVDYLQTAVLPYLQAVEQLQQIIASVTKMEPPSIEVKSITIGSIDVSMSGVAEALRTVRDFVVPWRRKHDKEITGLDGLEKAAAVKKAEAEAYAQKAASETAVAREKATVERMFLENDALRLEIEKNKVALHESKIKLSLNVMNSFNVELPEERKIDYVMRLLEPLNMLANSPLEMQSFAEEVPELVTVENDEEE